MTESLPHEEFFVPTLFVVKLRTAATPGIAARLAFVVRHHRAKSASMKRSFREYLGFAVGAAFGIALLCLPLYLHLGLLGYIWFGGIGLTILFSLLAEFSKSKDKQSLFSGASSMIEDGIVGVFMLLPVLYLAYVILKRIFE